MDGKKIAGRLVKLRDEKTQTEVAAAIGVSRAALAMYESGKRIPKDNIKIKLSEYYRQTVQSLFYAD